MIEARSCTWNNGLHRAPISEALCDDPGYGIDDLRCDVMRADALIFDLYDEGELIGHLVVRKDRNECVVQIVTGSGVLKNLDAWLAGPLAEIAKGMGCDTFRGHVESAALVKFYQRHGFEQTEVVVKRKVV